MIQTVFKLIGWVILLMMILVVSDIIEKGGDINSQVLLRFVLTGLMFIAVGYLTEISQLLDNIANIQRKNNDQQGK